MMYALIVLPRRGIWPVHGVFGEASSKVAAAGGPEEL